MKMAHSMQGIYAPLPQSLSDSDSEKEISMEPICTSYNSKNTNHFEDSFKNGHGIHMDDDIVKIKRGAGKMSTARKIAFVTSIILCFLPIFIFLWVLPCSELNTCPIKTLSWEYNQDDIELKGPINPVSGLYKTNYNLAIMYKGSFNSPKALKHGVISFMGLTGNVAWYFEQDVEPLKIDCSIIDTNKDGDFECLVVDSKGLKAIETVSGQAVWHAHSDEGNFVGNLDMPVSISDLNNDGVEELLSPYEKEFLVLSGQTGTVLKKIPVKHCNQIKDLYKMDKFLTFTCTNGTAQLYKIKLSELERTYVSPMYHMSIEPLTDEVKDNVFYSANKKLTVNNGQGCPKCDCTLTLYDDKEKILQTWRYENAFLMNPKPFSFEASKAKKTRLRGHLNGFVVKVWLWSKQNDNKLKPTQRINKRFIHSSANETFYSTDVTEMVLLITFNDTHVHDINASVTELSQICKQHNQNCQPSIDNQKDSILVKDLENDANIELVNYYSSYVRRGEDWHLNSFVKVLRLEEEMPKLFGNK